ncbi:hypothetical protein DQ04_06531020 [Trypanosoma grayi]|uniref:hypothetical protein n=1 Tax=Trypanosoma grayi TaxID=71804 RepID=UPI0004F4B09A|nr:hypothetical protein DQ04_06531020 [Trypanosoma grayi]KEG08742.1 hypothetical protein DQ04_06531020 [Trypanosoma grayi]
MLSLLLVSPFHRCIETALIVNIVGFDGRLSIFVDPLLSEWHSPKLFSRPPLLGGGYACTAADVITFRPQWEALHMALPSFFRSAAADVRYDISDAMLARWLAALETRWAQRPAFLLWTSASTRDSLRRGACSRSSTANRPSSNNDTRGNNLSGIRYPENASGLLRRVGEAVHVHFDADAGTAAVVPPHVREAALQDAKGLPRTIARRSAPATAEATTSVSSGGALLPPTRTLLVTHAEVVSMMLKHCCPKYHAADSGFSVPYCSLTSVSRSNDYYGAPGDVSLNARPLREERTRDWNVEVETSTLHLLTTIVLQYV